MTKCRWTVVSGALASAALLAACSGTPGADQILAMPESQQRQAIMACQAEQGFNIPEAVNVLRLNNGSVAVSVINGPDLSLAQARSINQCAQAKLLSGQVTVTADATYVKVADPLPVTQDVSQSDTQPTRQAGCIRGNGTMQAGTLICPGY